MKKTELKQGWSVRCLSRPGASREVTIPHDAMLGEERRPESLGEGNIGWFIGGDYEYRRILEVPESWKGRMIILEFEGVYHEAEVYINGEKAEFHPYGYTGFFIKADSFLRYGARNELRVIARNEKQPNSRWYSGTGLYRPVNLYVSEEDCCLPPDALRVCTRDHRTGTVEVQVRTSRPGQVELTILDSDGEIVNTCMVDAPDSQAAVTSQDTEDAMAAHQTVFTQLLTEPDQDGCGFYRAGATLLLRVSDPRLWSPETPYLYRIHAKTGKDCHEETFGIRSLNWNAAEGLTINGKRVILRGACIHHDNGILGACAFPEAEERKVRILKENGYNALRSAHNPCSKAMLDACDRLGMLMMDEYVDAWYMHKTKYDHVTWFMDWWKKDLTEMVRKDFNHPSVIMYSTGNEVAETAQPKGIQLTGEMTRFLHGLDPTRPVTCGINIFFNFLSSIGMGVYSDEKAEKSMAAAEKNRKAAEQASGREKKKKKKAVGSEFYNKLACLMGDKFMKFGATLPPCDVRTRDAFANMDIAGYNYGIWRYRHDFKKYPDRLILGSETFCKDAWLFASIAKDHPQLIGDFVWAGMDYIGETGAGAPEYGNYHMDDDETQMTGGNGRIDLTGKPRAEAAYTKAALGVENGPFIAVQPVDRTDKPGLTGWTLTKAIESWSFEGCEGRQAKVEVYARADRIELYVNGKKAGEKKASRTCRTIFSVPYEPGELTAVSKDAQGKEIGRQTLCSAGGDTRLLVLPEETEAAVGQLVFVRLRFTDENGIWKPLCRDTLRVTVENGTLIGLGSANSYVRGGYLTDRTDTYYGEALAAIRTDGDGDVTITVRQEKTGEESKGRIRLKPEYDQDNKARGKKRVSCSHSRG